MKKTLPLLLALLLLASNVASCSSTQGQAEETQGESIQQEETNFKEDETQAETADNAISSDKISRDNAKSNLPDLDYNGAEITIHCMGGRYDEIGALELNGETYNRNVAVSDLLNIKITPYEAPGTYENYGDVLVSLRSSIKSADHEYDIVAGWGASIPQLSVKGVLSQFESLFLFGS